MLDMLKEVLANQFQAALCTLHVCVDLCPDSVWNARVGNHAFCRVAFHTLFYADYYLGANEESFRAQAFHRDNEAFFGDYEEFADREPTALYERAGVENYVEHCRKKVSAVIASETADSLRGPSGFARRNFSRAELHVYNIRHIQHHAAQLTLRLRLDAPQDIPWIGSGWRHV